MSKVTNVPFFSVKEEKEANQSQRMAVKKVMAKEAKKEERRESKTNPH